MIETFYCIHWWAAQSLCYVYDKEWVKKFKSNLPKCRTVMFTCQGRNSTVLYLPSLSSSSCWQKKQSYQEHEQNLTDYRRMTMNLYLTQNLQTVGATCCFHLKIVTADKCKKCWKELMTNNLLHAFSICLAKSARTMSKNKNGNSIVLFLLHILWPPNMWHAVTWSVYSVAQNLHWSNYIWNEHHTWKEGMQEWLNI